MLDIGDQVNGGSTSVDADEFNSHKNELQLLVEETGQTLPELGDADITNQLRQALSMYGASTYYIDSGSVNTYELSQASGYTQINNYFDGLTVIFSTSNANTGASTAKIGSLGAKKIYFENVLLEGNEIFPNEKQMLIYDSTLDTGSGGWKLTSINSAKSEKLTFDFTTDANLTLSALQNSYNWYWLTDTGTVLTTTRTIYIDTKAFSKKTVYNATAQSLIFRVIGDVGTSVTVASGEAVLLQSDGTDVVSSVFTIGTSTADAVYEFVDPDGAIVGKNSNGEYVKNVDGNMICYYVGNITTGTASEFSFVFPHPFIDKKFTSHTEVIRIGETTDVNSWVFVATELEINYNNTFIAKVFANTLGRLSSTSLDVKTTTIGRWK